MIKQKEYWDSIADEKEFTVPLNIGIFRKYINKNALILDYGCGYGRTLNQLKENGYNNLIGIDFSEKMIARGNRLFPEIRLEVIDKEYILPNNHYDVVILFAVLTCIESNEKQKRLISSIYEALKIDGIIYIIDFLLNNDSRNVERYNRYRTKYSNYGTFEFKEGGVVRHHDEKWIDGLLKRFKTLEYNRTQYKTMNGNISKAFLYFGRKEVE